MTTHNGIAKSPIHHVAVAKSRKQTMSQPGWVTTKPRLGAIRWLHRQQGRHNNTVDLCEIAMRVLLGNIEVATDKQKHVEVFAKEFGIKTSLKPLPTLRRSAARMWVVMTHMATERFCRKLSQELRKLRCMQGWIDSVDKKRLSPMAAFVQNLPEDVAHKMRALPEYDVLEYYRLVRNATVHGDDEAPEADALLEQVVVAHGDHLRAVYGRVPSKYCDIAYEDHLVFTRCLLNLSIKINDACDVSVAEVVAWKLSNKASLAEVRQAKKGKSALRSLASKWSAEYHLSMSDADALFGELSQFVASDPPSKERKARLRKVT